MFFLSHTPCQEEGKAAERAWYQKDSMGWCFRNGFLFVCLCVRVCVWICLGLCVVLFSSATAGSISLVLLWHRMLGCDRWWQKLLSQRMGKKSKGGGTHTHSLQGLFCFNAGMVSTSYCLIWQKCRNMKKYRRSPWRIPKSKTATRTQQLC